MNMITNLFSIFDPATPNFFRANWLAIFIFSLFLPVSFWKLSRRYSITNFGLSSYILSQFNPLIPKTPFALLIIFTFFLFIIYNNLIGLLSYIFTSTSHITITMSMALPCWLTAVTFGWINFTNKHFEHLIPQGTPPVLMPFIVLIESIRNIIRPITLAVRLRANIIAGHLLISLLRNAIRGAPLYGIAVAGIAAVALSSLELAVAFVQGYVFRVLITLYTAEAVN